MGTNFDFVGDILNRYANNTPSTPQQTNNNANNDNGGWPALYIMRFY